MKVDDFFARLAEHHSARPALVGCNGSLDYGTLRAEAARLATMLRARGVRVLATLLDNGPAWAIVDLAALHAGIVHVPIPGFFTPQQTAFVLEAAGVDTLATTTPFPNWTSHHRDVAGERLVLCSRTPDREVPLHPGTAKVTFTSGTTGTPKGVCLSAESMLAVAEGLARATSTLSIARHLCALPLALLLENVAGLYAPLLTGAASVVPSTRDAGLEGSSQFDPAKLDAAVEAHAAQSVIVLPQMLRAWSAWRRVRCETRESDRPALDDAARGPLRFIAVGGAPVGVAAIASARAVGLPAYEGYGLSEGASVQALNLPDADRPGSVGRALPHARVRVAPDGEIEIAGSVMVGYLGEPAIDAAPRADDSPGEETWWKTGDVGTIDAEGYVHVHGRRRNVLITAYGRNVAPEWVETALVSEPAIAHAAVQGDGKPALEAVLWPAHAEIPDEALATAVDRANATLPDYARVRRFVRARVPYTAQAGICTPNGRPQRRAIEAMHADAFAADPTACGAATYA
ncbi:MAG TPA: AMP-binding protein [Casimicrobiaceae bacterium]|nr:AMP-binding protein [Casimicrobiaceae bacterium]